MAEKKPANVKAGVLGAYPEANEQWRAFADKLGLKFFKSGRFYSKGPRIEGEYRGRHINISLKSEGGGQTPVHTFAPTTYTVLTAGVQSRGENIELVPKDVDEWGGRLSSFFRRLRKIKTLHDSKFEEKFILYSTDEFFATSLFDSETRGKILSMGEVTWPRIFVGKKEMRIKERGIANPERLKLWLDLLVGMGEKIRG